MATRGWGLFSLYIFIENFKNLLVRNQWSHKFYFRFCRSLASVLLGGNVSLMILYQGCLSCHDSSKNMAARERGLFSLYIYVENLKKVSRKKHLDRVQCNLAGLLLWWPSTKIIQALLIRQKTWPPWGRGLFSVYICIENFKILLERSQLTNFNISWQECCFGDPLPRLFKKSWFVRKRGC